jgi:hypothetical protein
MSYNTSDFKDERITELEAEVLDTAGRLNTMTEVADALALATSEILGVKTDPPGLDLHDNALRAAKSAGRILDRTRDDGFEQAIAALRDPEALAAWNSAEQVDQKTFATAASALARYLTDVKAARLA